MFLRDMTRNHADGGCANRGIVGERKLGHHLLEFDPETPAHAFTVLRQPIGRFKTHAVFGRCHCRTPSGPVPTQSEPDGLWTTIGDVRFPLQGAGALSQRRTAARPRSWPSPAGYRAG